MVQHVKVWTKLFTNEPFELHRDTARTGETPKFMQS